MPFHAVMQTGLLSWMAAEYSKHRPRHPQTTWPCDELSNTPFPSTNWILITTWVEINEDKCSKIKRIRFVIRRLQFLKDWAGHCDTSSRVVEAVVRVTLSATRSRQTTLRRRKKQMISQWNTFICYLNLSLGPFVRLLADSWIDGMEMIWREW